MTGLLSAALAAMMALSPAGESIAPREKIGARMTLIEVMLDGDMSRSTGTQYHGQCRRFQSDSFLDAAQGFALKDSPELVLSLPIDHMPAEDSGRPVGLVWAPPENGMVCAYEAVAVFDYDPSLSVKRNREAAREFLSNVRAGDVLQMIGVFSGGARGTHTLMFSQPYDPRDDALYWIDSNFSNTRVDGVRYGYVRARQSWPINDLVSWFAADERTGATLYRLREDIVEE